MISLATIALLTDVYKNAKKIETQAKEARVYNDDSVNKYFKPVSKPAGFQLPIIKRNTAKSVTQIGNGHYVVEFEKTTFGSVELNFKDVIAESNVEVRLGEKKDESGRIWLPASGANNQGNNIAFHSVKVNIAQGQTRLIVPVPERFRPSELELPGGMKAVFPFRYVEIIGTKNKITKSNIVQLMVHYPFDDKASNFKSSSEILDSVWDISKYSIKATSYSGIYLDGNRERKPYEADSYINQLGHYAIDREYLVARHTQEYLLENPTNPTEWIMHSIQMAYADFMHTGDLNFLEKIYSKLKPRTLVALRHQNGLISTKTGLQNKQFLDSINMHNGVLEDIVDWPPVERDSYDKVVISSFKYIGMSIEYFFRVFRSKVVSLMGFPYASSLYQLKADRVAQSRFEMPTFNSVVNIMHYNVLEKMSYLSFALGKTEDAIFYKNCANITKASIQSKLIDPTTGLFVDGVASSHSSLHANMYALAFDLVPQGNKAHVIKFIKSKGMACSVFGAQYLLEALFMSGESDYAMKLLSAKGDRGWWHMMHGIGSTITLESWNHEINPGMDWNHAWGTAPANIISRWVMGVRPLSPGFKRFTIQPQPENLLFANIDVPINKSTISLNYKRASDESIEMIFSVPPGTSAEVYIPTQRDLVYDTTINGAVVKGNISGKSIALGGFSAGFYKVNATVRRK